jgi:hypothetical protein
MIHFAALQDVRKLRQLAKGNTPAGVMSMKLQRPAHHLQVLLAVAFEGPLSRVNSPLTKPH